MMTRDKLDKFIQILFAVWLGSAIFLGVYFRIAHKPLIAPKPATQATPYTDIQLAGWFKFYNEQYFSEHLPKNTVVTWAFLDNKYGETQPPTPNHFTIRLDIVKNREALMARSTLLHEMAHIATYEKGFDHGPAWRTEIHRLMVEGAFDDLV